MQSARGDQPHGEHTSPAPAQLYDGLYHSHGGPRSSWPSTTIGDVARTSGAALRIFSLGVNWAGQLLALMRRQQVTTTLVQTLIKKDATNRHFFISTVHDVLLLSIGCTHSRLLSSALKLACWCNLQFLVSRGA